MIEVKNVSKKYGKFYAVKNISFEIKEGEIVGFLGKNGAGKSTTMNMLTGFIEPTEGEITIGGYDISRKPNKVKALIGYMPEGVPLYTDLTVKEFVGYMADLKLVPRKKKKEEVNRVLEKTGLIEVQNKLTRNLSRGYKQRVSMAGALVGDPKIIILDEPTVGLDPKQVTEIREFIKSLRKDHTVILSSHILSEVSQICEKVIIINEGEILAVDTPSNLEENVNEINKLIVTIDDIDSKFETVASQISSVSAVKFLENAEEQSKKYIVEYDKNEDIRKELFAICAKENIIILEMKKDETSLEDAFIKIVDENVNESSAKVEENKNEDEEVINEEVSEETNKEISDDEKTENNAEKEVTVEENSNSVEPEKESEDEEKAEEKNQEGGNK